ncbi:long-chain-fatty-acid--CoA ligase [Achromobacter sp. GG226]|uniref:3-(methylthio)propionyl-CoA ligase n=1 Tax=Verticiella alkaliphila TaxID=2779529 RepID=UPI001C0E4FB2|nr:3-(methylthio)propionyl-CoA ligase [Verticiella sp. GG226]MBU4611700.1 long-chain-fatty-acid--CoA ligase [Verticiella sp. GG226]
MFGLMMQQPLLISSLIRYADRFHGDTEIVSRRVEGDIHRTTYHEVHERARRLAHVLVARGVKPGDRIATLAWNGYRHLELYFAISGIGAVMHTVNPRLHPNQIAWIANDASDTWLFYDTTFQPLVDGFAAQCANLKTLVAMTDAARLPASKVEGVLAYEDLIAEGSAEFDWPELDENVASSLCYTSGTTGNPKGVLYSHRSTLLHTMVGVSPDVLGLSASDVVLPVVPMFHVNAWGIPYMGAMTGAKLVFPGPNLDGASLYELFETEGVTLSAGVPTVWQGLLGHVQKQGLRFSSMRRTVIGGSACPPAMLAKFENEYDVRVIHAWGMTETSPIGSACALKPKHRGLSKEAVLALKGLQGRPPFGVDIKILGPDGQEQPWDGKTEGELLARGPWVLARYFGREDQSPLVDGWFPTGDVCSIDPDGFIHITDRSKDVIKSGGEWISSIELENIAMAHPDVAMAACIAVPHPKWDERPLLVVVKRPEATVDREAMLAWFQGKVAKWQEPDDVVFVEAIPLGATGKMLKTSLRETYGKHPLPETK